MSISCTWSRCITTLRFASNFSNALGTLWVPFLVKNKVRSAFVSTALAEVLYWSHNACTANCHLHCTYMAVEKRNEAQRRTKVSPNRTIMQALELLRLAKRHIFWWNDMEQYKHQAHSLSGDRVTLFWKH